MSKSLFPTTHSEILARIDEINPIQYAKNRNYVDGAVTYLSPYISRGVISTRQVMETVLSKGFTMEQSGKLIQELAWREYFQRVWQYLEDDLFEDIRQRYTGIRHTAMPTAILKANTGIEAIDKAIGELYTKGYMHNHLRMYTASLCCNIAKAHWQTPSQWMYYHLLDGDLASNTCSWQWVAGTFSAKQYFFNQQNVNQYTGSNQHGTFIDVSYDELNGMGVPDVLAGKTSTNLQTVLPETKPVSFDYSLPLLIYNSYNLHPEWRADMSANRLLLLEPSHFKQYPVSQKVVDFIIALSANINGLQVMVGEIRDIPGLKKFPCVYSKEHPAFKHYPGIKDERDWLFPEVKGLQHSFFRFWKEAERLLMKKQVFAPHLQRA
jgi:deoxyribodipyrimidine photo-lyase